MTLNCIAGKLDFNLLKDEELVMFNIDDDEQLYVMTNFGRRFKIIGNNAQFDAILINPS